MDYKELLKKYMGLVISEESVSYLRFANHPWCPEAPTFTNEDLVELHAIQEAIEVERS